MLDDNGLQAIASHEGLERLREDAGAIAGRLGELGCPCLIVPWMPEADRATAETVGRFAAEVGVFTAFERDCGTSCLSCDESAGAANGTPVEGVVQPGW